MVSIGERIKESRNQKKITQQELAAKLNVTRSAVSNWEINRNYPDLDTIVQLSDILEVPLDKLLREDTVMVSKVSSEQKKGIKRKVILRILVPLFIILLFTTGYLLYSEVSSVRNVFSPNVTGFSKVETKNDWTVVNFEGSQDLKMSSIFWNKEIVNDAGSTDIAEIRIFNKETGEVIYENKLNPGTSDFLTNLESGQNYLVEIKGNEGDYFLNFN